MLVGDEGGVNIRKACGIYKLSRQHYYQGVKKQREDNKTEEFIKRFIEYWRKTFPVIGGKKIYSFIKHPLKDRGIKMGRDKFLEVYKRLGFSIKRRARYIRTTNSMHHYNKHKNLIKDIVITGANQAVGSDITYIRVKGVDYMYLFLIMDLYSRKIVGYHLSRSLGVDGGIKALRMALKDGKKWEYHHSDRGIQYCSHEYTKLLTSEGIKISMGEKGNPYENAKVERLNGILKQEFGLSEVIASEGVAQKLVRESIRNYNELRPHLSLGYQTPSRIHGRVA